MIAATKYMGWCMQGVKDALLNSSCAKRNRIVTVNLHALDGMVYMLVCLFVLINLRNYWKEAALSSGSVSDVPAF